MLYASSIRQYRIRHFIVSYAKRWNFSRRVEDKQVDARKVQEISGRFVGLVSS
jgi:hypothetical protein